MLADPLELIENIKENFPEIDTSEYDIYSQCVEDVLSGKVEAVTTDAAILIGYAAQDLDNLKVLDGLFTEERYGVGIPKGDTALQEYINTMLTEGGDKWQEIFDATLPDSRASRSSSLRSTRPADRLW